MVCRKCLPKSNTPWCSLSSPRPKTGVWQKFYALSANLFSLKHMFSKKYVCFPSILCYTNASPLTTTVRMAGWRVPVFKEIFEIFLPTTFVPLNPDFQEFFTAHYDLLFIDQP